MNVQGSLRGVVLKSKPRLDVERVFNPVWSKYSNVLRVGDSKMDSDDGGQEELAETAGLRNRLDQSRTAVADRVSASREPDS